MTRGTSALFQSNPRAATIVSWIEETMGTGARVVGAAELQVSATTKHLIEVSLPDGSARRLVLRRFHNAERLAHDPWYVPAHEALALELLADTDVPAPRLYAADLEPAACDVPALLESWVLGAPAWQPKDLDGYMARAAEVLVRIHAVGVPSRVRLPRYAPYRGQERVVAPPFSNRARMWDRVADILDEPWPAHHETFIHRDYHPGNVLWDGTQVTGVVDWATTAWGPPGIDLARMRLNLAARHGKQAADRFSECYGQAGGDPSARHAYWDLLDAADVLLDLTAPSWLGGGDFARFEDHVEGVLAELRGSSPA